MAFGYGPGNEMQKTQKRNKSLLGKRKSLKELNKENGPFSGKQELKFKEPTPEELASFKAKLQKDLQKDRHRRQILLLASVIIGLLLIYILTSVPI